MQIAARCGIARNPGATGAGLHAGALKVTYRRGASL
jgi:hypothetical protein